MKHTEHRISVLEHKHRYRDTGHRVLCARVKLRTQVVYIFGALMLVRPLAPAFFEVYKGIWAFTPEKCS